MSMSFEDLSFHLFSYLEALPGFRDLEKVIRSGTTVANVTSWHDKHAPFMLPDDLLGLLAFTDGLFFRWRALSLETEIVVGSFCMNKLSDIIRLDDSPHATTEDIDLGLTRTNTAAFLIERNIKVGDVALVYSLDEKNCPRGGPEVWFRDRYGQWHYIASSFSCYYRLLLVHLGILGWQYAFTPNGLAPLTVQWMRLYCPERLMYDSQQRHDLMSQHEDSQQHT
mmetsp:Transcript_32356/g.37974  ORF Transcript_32356/g.37974 Transcript_32356/m.37974 type:complete len:224 (+) Transcript_32356:84-755(+)